LSAHHEQGDIVLKEFREFAFKGNLLEIAIGLILALAFSAVVTAFVDGIIMAFIAAIFGEPNFDSIVWNVGDGQIRIGSFITALVNFLIVAWVLFMIVRTANRYRRDPEAAPISEDVALLREIRDLLAQR
jgi:large conductance mechanosensitive channel